MSNEIVLYQANELPERIEVRLDNETVWLNQDQMSSLFQRDQSVISRHIRNIYKEGELEEKSTMQKMHIPNSDKPVAYYNLDVIISVGYRVKSKQGTQFRIWATNVLRDYLLKGYVLNQRMNRIENNVEQLTSEVSRIALKLETTELPRQGVFFDGQVFDAYELTSKIIRSAKQSIVLIDNYINENTLTHLSKKADGVQVLLLTKTISKQLTLDVKKANEQYGFFEAKPFSKSHDRFLIIDNSEVYHLGASLKDLGKKWFAFSKMDKSSVESILKGTGNE
ncbi:Virulence protein RhuM family protein [Cyclonatronum proteinivorum]|uniref:Virulence protein RhuM family protein n=1 Tax=Cyclonatronum proteinivorum TaxID=1457365 RepID=A0A345UJN4_9BACT|nr:RhuM family protein [Cyclonatronum proteinivorum]AXJ00686.1 Virulence protein RhuM family protein [Cyclonatronum proteinivorum]